MEGLSYGLRSDDNDNDENSNTQYCTIIGIGAG